MPLKLLILLLLVLAVAVAASFAVLRHKKDVSANQSTSSGPDASAMYEKVQSGQVTVVVSDSVTGKQLDLTKEQQGEIVKAIYSPTAWKDIPVSATAPTILLTVKPQNDTFLLDSHYAYRSDTLSKGIPIGSCQALSIVVQTLKGQVK